MSFFIMQSPSRLSPRQDRLSGQDDADLFSLSSLSFASSRNGCRWAVVDYVEFRWLGLDGKIFRCQSLFARGKRFDQDPKDQVPPLGGTLFVFAQP
jgi:hypothetical protein